MGCEVEKPDSGCCGMAGAWGYEHGHYDVSVKCGERVLLPKVREAPRDTLIVTAGFSCREQIEQGKTGRKALHLAQVIRLAQEYGPDGPPGAPEDAAAAPPAPPATQRAARVAAAAGVAAAVAGGVAWSALRR
jgi:hypothetical protein